VVASYVYNQVSDGLGKIGVIVGLESAGSTAYVRFAPFATELSRRRGPPLCAKT
jgi:hypothetical protein